MYSHRSEGQSTMMKASCSANRRETVQLRALPSARPSQRTGVTRQMARRRVEGGGSLTPGRGLGAGRGDRGPRRWRG